uniref:Fe2OG dioxygenase domain-containing protein n=1 Tax=Chromera velia CCMP2878 TaxID=1169474 RepID=A0A0G4HMU0_9ALVE|eukprot:Cvel_7531.t1-p1 / transcript=Cvel_7531.t1 / gene=Cvel_7531 / organism=Chromera_velia_CCMP2878 / gene_product=Probable alpha-ketoglutarate-dependent, putative / transcript_product=Probable alpha-ketoglutarate-dependent, putative / location=Cvel_scaffold396:20678-21322(-) / protein_length=215 / sequence_SO=supercontig / SO=protein_coding / is_pseudo=false
MNREETIRAWETQGFASPLDVITETEAASHRSKLEDTEALHGPMHYKAKVHTLMKSPYELATHPKVLDAVEPLLGPDILLYDVQYIVKEPHSKTFVSWHQDLTYWGLSDDAQVSLWLALSPATAESGCMRMLPGSHKGGRAKHHPITDGDNVLLNGQTVMEVDESKAVLCPLQPGQATLHHGWTLHASMPNKTDDRRIGLNVQYIAPHMRQTKHN